MKKTSLAIVMFVIGGAFVVGVAVGKSHMEAKYVSMEEHKWDDLGGPKMAGINGDYKKGAYTGLLKIPAGFTSPMHTHSSAYEAIQVLGTSTHWVKGEDGSKAKKMTPGSYWTMPAKMEHVSSCAAGADCVIVLMQKGKFDFKDTTPKDPKATMPAKDPKATTPAVTTPPAKDPKATTPPATTPAKDLKATTPPATTPPVKKP